MWITLLYHLEVILTQLTVWFNTQFGLLPTGVDFSEVHLLWGSINRSFDHPPNYTIWSTDTSRPVLLDNSTWPPFVTGCIMSSPHLKVIIGVYFDTLYNILPSWLIIHIWELDTSIPDSHSWQVICHRLTPRTQLDVISRHFLGIWYPAISPIAHQRKGHFKFDFG